MYKPLLSGNFRRGFLLGTVSLLLAGLLWQGLSHPPPAYGQVPDSGAQRERMIRELVTTNKKLSEIATLLKEIRAINAGETPAKKPAKPGRRQP